MEDVQINKVFELESLRSYYQLLNQLAEDKSELRIMNDSPVHATIVMRVLLAIYMVACRSSLRVEESFRLLWNRYTDILRPYIDNGQAQFYQLGGEPEYYFVRKLSNLLRGTCYISDSMYNRKLVVHINRHTGMLLGNLLIHIRLILCRFDLRPA